MGTYARVLGTTPEAIERAEQALDRRLPPSFHAWLLSHNGRDLDGLRVFPVLDDRDPRSTWHSIVRNFSEEWSAWLENEDRPDDLASLLPFAEFGTGDFFCFDYANVAEGGEAPVVLWSHEGAGVSPCGESFAAFATRWSAGEFDDF